MPQILYILAGLALGALVTLAIMLLNKRDAASLAQELVNRAQKDKEEDLNVFLQRIKDSFGAISLDALSQSLSHNLQVAKSALSEQASIGAKDLDGKKELIFKTYDSMKVELEKVGGLINEFEKERQAKYGELSNLLTTTGAEVSRLSQTTQQLSTALVSAEVRGSWGQRMAEDVLRLAGFVEGINYCKQQQLATSANRPDFTFTLPNAQKVNMDVKFPFNNYWSYLSAQSEPEKDKLKRQFLRDVRGHIKAVTSRDYINPDDNTIDLVIMFIPNEQVYQFINEHDGTVLDEAIRNKVALCSPLTLFAVLAIIRQAIDNFNLEKTANEILALMGSFYQQWKLFGESLRKMGKRIEDAQSEYNHLVTTRSNQLQRPLDRIELLRQQKGIPAAEEGSQIAGEIGPSDSEK